MWNKAFENLRRRMTFIYVMIFSLLILVIVAASAGLTWWHLVMREKQDLIATIYHEGEEYVDSEEEPVSDVSMRDASMLAYFVAPDGKTVILDQLGTTKAGELIRNHMRDWPAEDESAHMLRIRDESGKRYRYLAAVAPVMDGEKNIGRLYMFKDIDFYYHAGMEILFWLACIALVLFLGASLFGYWLAGKNIQPINQMYEKQKQFTADASHEMRTPLAVLSLAVEGLENDEDSTYSDFARESIAMLKTEVTRLSNMTHMLMELARQDNVNMLLQKENVNFSVVCDHAVKMVQVLAAARGSVITAAVPKDIHIQADKDAVARLPVILLDNAVKYSPENAQINLRLQEKGSSVILEVADNGCGISDADKEKIFDRFYRVDKARSRSEGGLGLGLSLAWSIVKMHNGKISVKDNVPQGTIMQVILPK